jgi:DNA-binding transcriptional LysR family regulator
VIRIHTLVASESRNLSGPIRLTLPEGFSTAFFVDSLQKLRENSPEISIELIADPSIVSLTKREADIAIMMERPNQGPLVSRKLCDYEYGLYCSKDYIDSAVDLRLASDLEKHFIIGYIPDLLPTPSHNYLKDFFNDKRPDLQISNILTQVEAAARGLDLAFLPCFMASRRTELIRLLADEVNFIRAYWIVTHEDPRYPSRTARVKDFIIEQVQQNGPSFRPSAYRQRN